MYFAEHFAIEHLFIRKINFKFRSGLSEEWTKYYIHSQRVLHSSLFKIKFFLKEKFCVQLCHILGVVLLFFKNFFLHMFQHYHRPKSGFLFTWWFLSLNIFMSFQNISLAPFRKLMTRILRIVFLKIHVCLLVQQQLWSLPKDDIYYFSLWKINGKFFLN